MKRSVAFYLSFSIGLASGCSKQATETVDSGSAASPSKPAGAVAPTDELCEAELGDADPVHAVGNVYLAGQPQQADLAELAERGIKTIVTLRKPDELDWDEAAAVEAAGMEFVAVPFDGPEELTDDVFDRVRQVLRDGGDQPLVLHCGRANRVGAVWMVHRVLDDGVGIEAALEEAKTVGLRTPEYIDKAQAYIRQKQTAGVDKGDVTPSP